MGRRVFLQHLVETAAASIPHIQDVYSPDDGVTSCLYSYTKNNLAHVVNIVVHAADVDEYPDGTTYMLYTNDENAEPVIPRTLQTLTPVMHGKTIHEVLLEVSQVLTDTLSHGAADNPIDVDAEEQASDSESFSEGDDLDEDDLGLDDLKSPNLACSSPAMAEGMALPKRPAQMAKLAADLRAVKDAGFRVGILGDLENGGIVCVSIRVVKLGISEEAMQAWSLRRKHYLVLLIRFRSGYRDISQVKEDDTLTDATVMRIGLCEHYKPTMADALSAFLYVKSDGEPVDRRTHVSMDAAPALEHVFIGRPLHDLLRDRFTRIVKCRESHGFKWHGAENWVNDLQGKSPGEMDDIDTYLQLDDSSGSRALSAIVRADEMDGKELQDASLPLVAMQFVLRHFVRCTEFCLVCHCRVEESFEALKPYVCSRPLCLYQYMTLGFGPSIEWELLSQPYVVDLLVSFCYAAARCGRIKEFPVGINLKVPVLPRDDKSTVENTSATAPTSPEKSFSAHFDMEAQELIFVQSQYQDVATLKVNDWVVIISDSTQGQMHCRVTETTFPVVRLSKPVIILPQNTASNTSSQDRTPPSQPSIHGLVEVDCYCYSRSFDDLAPESKMQAIATLLDTLPSVIEMHNYLDLQQQGPEPHLRGWCERVSDSALNLLRWIIASNRSCIMQVDRVEQDDISSRLSVPPEDRVGGMDDWMQFRFAQGAPDKEQRFLDHVNQEAASTGTKYPTIFAWHGSALSNWHSIIRQGLRFDEILNGRRYGHGVYMSKYASKSLQYTSGIFSLPDTESQEWPHSVLKISQAFSLQEVVNRPYKFIRSDDCYVVDKIDWIQTRYLLVQSGVRHSVSSNPSTAYEQDPSAKAYNENDEPITVPITAISKSRRPAVGPAARAIGNKRLKTETVTNQAAAECQEDDANSTISDDGDLMFLEFDQDPAEHCDAVSLRGDDDHGDTLSPSVTSDLFPTTPLCRKRGRENEGSDMTDFTPGTLDVSQIRFLQPPKNATGASTTALMKSLKDALATQNKTPLPQLGWYIDPDHVTNLYQWIVELHSFDASLPLAQDMKTSGVTSIVLEIRFTNQYPFSPPFIRVVTPRFRPFHQGGGGHVTLGGAICMELLTNNGWSAAYTMESVLLQVQMALCEEEPPARLARKGPRVKAGSSDSYGIADAVVAYERACRNHGWTVPAGFASLRDMR